MRRIALFAAILALPACAAADMMQPGLYTTTVDSPGEKPERKTSCISQKDIDEGLSGFGGQRDQGCKVLDMKRGSGSVSYRTTCASENVKMSTQVNGTFSRDSFDMNIAMTVNAEQPIRMHMTGKRIGDCSKKK